MEWSDIDTCLNRSTYYIGFGTKITLYTRGRPHLEGIAKSVLCTQNLVPYYFEYGVNYWHDCPLELVLHSSPRDLPLRPLCQTLELRLPLGRDFLMPATLKLEEGLNLNLGPYYPLGIQHR